MMVLSNLVQPEYYHLIDAIAYFIVAAVPVYFLVKSRNNVNNGGGIGNNNNPLRKAMAVLAGFVLAQGAYHIAGMLGLTLLSKVVLEPLSAAVLVSVALAYLFTRRKMLKREVDSPIGK